MFSPRPLLLLIILAEITSIVAAANAQHRARAMGRPPNIILIVADDLGWGDVGVYGQDKIRTPNIDQMSKEGMRFNQFYAGSPVCAPSRCVLLTGRHGGHAYIRDNREIQPEGQEPIPAGEITIPRLLKERGYATGAFGKWGLGFVGSEGEPNKQGFDQFYGYNCQREAHNYYPDHLWRNDRRINLEGNSRGLTGKQYSHDLIEAESLEFIRSHRDEPFFALLAYTIPHLALQVPDDSIAEYIGKWDDPPYDGKNGYLPHPHPRAAYAGMVTRLDRSVGRVLTMIRDLGLDENTLIIFTSDNGGAFGEVTPGDFEFKPGRLGGTDYRFFRSAGPFRAFKGSVYEGGIRVPFIARWPGRIRPGSISERPAVFYDLLPTICEIAGVPKPPATDGLSFRPALLGNGRQRPHEFIFWDFNGYGGQQAVRLGDWKGIRRNVQSGNVRVELYNLAQDVGETDNIAAGHPAIVRKIERIMLDQHVPSKLFPMEAVDRLWRSASQTRHK